MEALGLVLINASFRTLYDMMCGARVGKFDSSWVIESSVQVLVTNGVERHEHWLLIGRERFGGVSVL